MFLLKNKRIWTFLLSIAIVLSMLPCQTLAVEDTISSVTSVTEESCPEDTSIEADTSIDSLTENPVCHEYQRKINAILYAYLNVNRVSEEDFFLMVPTMTETEIRAIVDDMGFEYREAIYEISLLEEEWANDCFVTKVITESEIQFLVEKNQILYVFYQLLQGKYSTDNSISFFGSSVTVLDGLVSVESNQTNTTGWGAYTYIKESNGTVTAYGKGGGSPTTNTITIRNDSGYTATLSFDYVAGTNHGGITYNGQNESSNSGTKTAILGTGESVTMSVKGGRYNYSSYHGSLALSNFKLVKAAETSNVTVNFDSNLGSVKAKGSSITTGTTITGVSVTEGIALEATADTTKGAIFYGWVNEETHYLVSREPSYTLKPDADTTVTAAFASANTKAWFLVNGSYLYDKLNDAASVAGSGGTVLPVYNGTLSGEHTIPGGVTLLIPFNDENTIITSNMKNYVDTNYSNPPARTLYRQLTMKDGASIIVEGSLNVGSRASNQMVGQVGPYGAIVMEEGSSISVENDATLYAYGYIFHGTDGHGAVTVKNGGTVYESASMLDYIGNTDGTQTIYNAGAFPLRSFSFRNVEVPMTLYYGATENAFYSLYGTLAGLHCGYIPIIGKNSSSPFQLSEGTYITKEFISGKQHIEINGSCFLNSISITIVVTTLIFKEEVPVSSSETSGFPVPSNFDIVLKNGTLTLGDNVVMMEGSKLTIDSTATVNSNKKNIFVFDSQDDPGAVTTTGAWTTLDLADVHGMYYCHVDKDAVLNVNGTLNISGGFYTSAGNACITSSEGTGVINITTASSATEVTIKTGLNASGTYEVKPAQLKNADGVTPTFTDTSSGTGEYFYAHGLWHKKGDPVCVTCAEAQIGSTYYWTLAEAINAASAGGTVQLLKDVETAVTVSKPLVIARNAHSANITPESGLFLCTSDAAYAVTKGFTLKSAECSYEAEVVLRMKLYIPDEYLDGNYTIRLIKDGRWGDVETSYTMTQLKEDGADKNGLYWAMAGVASGEMTKNVTIDIQDGSGNAVTIFKPNGDPVGTSFSYTVKQYINAVQQSDARTPEEKAAAKALAVYGGYAQQYFKVSTDNLAYEGLELPDLSTVTADTVGHAVTYEGTEAGIRVKSFEPFLDSKTYLRLKFVIEDGSDISNFTFTMTGTDGKSKTLEAFYEAESKRYCVDILDIPAAYLDHTYPVTVTNKTTGKIHTVNASVLSWVNLAIRKSNNEEQVNMAKALYLYNQAANTLFKK